jgi:predicted dehydrogenase
MKSSRREFIKASSGIIAITGLTGVTPSFSNARSKKSPANDTIVIGLIGGRSQGGYIHGLALKQQGVECAAIADVDDTVLAERSGEVAKIQGKKPDTYKDYRKLLERKDIDAVVIGTPDHWHCLNLVHACEAGKDVYVEKPMANSIAECDIMVRAARAHKRIVQVGQQQRSGAHWKAVVEFIKNGKIGKIRKVQVWGNFNYGIGRPVVPDENPPAGVDFDMWLGPAPRRSFNNSRFHGSWRMFWDYGGGLMTDWGVHLIDMALWAKDITSPPLSAVATGGNFAFPDHAHETFDTMSVSWQMKDYSLSWEHTAGTQNGPYGRLYGLAFIGNDATLVADRSGWELFPETGENGYKVPAIPKQDTGRENHEEHVKDFLESIRSRKEPACPIENGRLVALYAHMANIALRTNSRLDWDPATNTFGNNKAANSLITPVYRKPWELPKY